MKFLPYVDELQFPTLWHVLRNDGLGRTIPIFFPIIWTKIISWGWYFRALAKSKAWGGHYLPNGRFYVPAIDMEFTNFYYFTIMANEWGSWERQYLVTDVRGKIVGDAGAACGDTLMLLMLHGAKKVVSIEPDPGRFACLKRNAEAHGWNVEAINRPMELSDLKRPDVDFWKIDIESQEKPLLTLDSLPPCVIETHGNEVTAAFVKKFHMKRMKRGREQSICTNIWS